MLDVGTVVICQEKSPYDSARPGDRGVVTYVYDAIYPYDVLWDGHRVPLLMAEGEIQAHDGAALAA